MSASQKLSSPKVVQELLRNAGLRPAKRWGQNFLCDENVLHKILDAAEIDSSDCVLEVGGGLGTLSQQLAHDANELRVVEIDPKLIPILQDNLSTYENAGVIEGDILELDWSELCPGQEKIKTVGNLPYNITSPLLEKLIKNRERIISATWMMQLEVANKITAEPGTRESSSLGVYLQSYCDVRQAFRVSKNAYYPKPEVDSAVLNMIPYAKPLFSAEPVLFNTLVRAAYGMRRKTLLKALTLSPAIDYSRDEIESRLAGAEIDSQRRGENLTIAEFDRIALEFESRS